MMSPPIQTLRERLPEFEEQRIEELIVQLNVMRVTNISSLKVMMTGRGAADLRNSVTVYGKRILSYIVEA